MLELARLSDTVVVNKESVNLLEEARSALSDIMPLALQKQQDLEFHPPEDKLPVQEFEPDALKTLIQNLVSNAITHTPPGSQIILGIDAGQQLWCLSVNDSGPGVSEEDRAQLAERFFSSGDTHGTGLGLSIVQRIVQRHHGRLTLNTSLLGGLEVQVCFPYNNTKVHDIRRESG
jgi:two-component system sensor histidine kinase QseC